MLWLLDNKLVTVDKAVRDQASSNLSSYASSYGLLLERSNLIGQFGTTRILQRNGTNMGIHVIPNYPQTR